MIAADWTFDERDAEFFRRHLDSFVPQRVYDAHGHLYARAQFLGEPPPLVTSGPDPADWDTYVAQTHLLIPGRDLSALLFPYPNVLLDPAVANEMLATEIRKDPRSRALMLVRPEDDPEFIRQQVRTHRFAGLKCYHIYAQHKPTWEAPIEDFLPENQVRIAHEENLAVMLHMVRERALADPANQATIRDFCTRYPGMRLILAHAARGFNPYHTIEGIESLRGIPNVWFDTSAVTEAGAFEAIMRTMGVDRLLFGFDFPVSHLRGRCIAIGDSFLWLSPGNTKFAANYADLRPSLIGLESLRALKTACWNLGLKDSQVEAVFSGNAERLLGVQANC